MSISYQDVTYDYLPIENLIQNHLRNTDTAIQIRNIQASSSACYALFDNGHSVGTTQQKSERLDADEYLIPNRGIMLSTAQSLDAPYISLLRGDSTGESDLASQVFDNKVDVFDSCIVQFEFSCPIDAGRYTTNVDFRYVFGSEEYESMNLDNGAEDKREADYNNDAFGVFLNGQNIALVPNSNADGGEDGLGFLPITINNINSKANSEFYIQNPSPSEIKGGGFTTEMRAFGKVYPGWNSIKFVIGDAGDSDIDSWVFLKEGSFSCTRVVELEPPMAFPTITGPTEIDMTDSLPTDNVPTESQPIDSDPEVNGVIVRSNLTMPMSMAVGILMLLGLLALAMPLIGLSFYDKKQTCGCGRNGKRYGKPKKESAKTDLAKEPV